MTFQINDKIKIEAEYYETRYSWGHKAWLYVDGQEVAYKKITYYNRTWERYTYETVISCVVDKAPLSKEDKALCHAYIKNYEQPSAFSHVAFAAAVGDILTDNKKDANDWKVRMLKAGLPEGAINMPEDWDTLSEDEKEIRLSGALKAIA